jgi:hypothetical protein
MVERPELHSDIQESGSIVTGGKEVIMSGLNWDKARKQKTIAERGQEISEGAVPKSSGKGYGRPQRKRWQKTCPKCGRYYFDDEQEVHDQICMARRAPQPKPR